MMTMMMLMEHKAHEIGSNEFVARLYKEITTMSKKFEQLIIPNRWDTVGGLW